MGKLGILKVAWILVFCAGAVVSAPAQSFNTLVSFDGANTPYGAYPAALVQGIDGNLYGTTQEGGTEFGCGYNDGCGTVFKITPAGELTTLHSFCSQPGCADGQWPEAGLVQATNGNLYGTSFNGGTADNGTAFKMTMAGKLTTLDSFCSQGGCPTNPLALTQAANGNFYGTTLYGGASSNGSHCPYYGCGTVIEITPSGQLTTLYNFCSQSNCTDGFFPYAGLVQGTDGNFYGTTYYGGSYTSGNPCYNGCGTAFRLTPAGKLTTLYTFCLKSNCPDGQNPYGGLLQATNGNLYGTTTGGGANTGGTVFEIASTGKLTTLYNFCSQSNCTDGSSPFAGLVQATDGNFYGTTFYGGANGIVEYAGAGTVFEVTPAGKLTTLYNFCSQPNCPDGLRPDAGLVQATDGNFYGTTQMGGTNYYGTLFSLSVGLGPFVETLPGAGKVGSEVGILGTNLTGASSVMFNGTPARFTVKSATLILAHVPAGATTGSVTVNTPSGGLTSNVPFRVIQ